MISQQELRARFAPMPGQDFEPVLQAFLPLAQLVNESCPLFLETERAMLALEEAQMWAGRALNRARAEGLLMTRGRKPAGALASVDVACSVGVASESGLE